MKDFKGTKGKHKLQFVSGVCIGIGVELEPNYTQMIANTILPDTDKEYAKQKEEIEANMQLYTSAPELLEACQQIMHLYEKDGHLLNFNVDIVRIALNKALGS